jgi:hypothetical protein
MVRIRPRRLVEPQVPQALSEESYDALRYFAVAAGPITTAKHPATELVSASRGRKLY